MNVGLRPQHLDILSLCTGGGGLDLGIELAIPSARSVVLVERESFAVASLVSAMEQGLLHPAPVWSDARTFDGRAWRGCVDGLIGGIPCQGHSLAGKKRGSLDERDLWSPARRIIVQARPWLVLIENVGGMLSPGDDDIAGAERVWRDLRKLGFTVEGGLFTASEVGASHERERIFILGVADGDDEQWGRQHEFDGGQGTGPREQSRRCGDDVADAGDARLQGREQRRPSGERHWSEAHGPTSELRGAHVADTDDRLGEQHARPRHDAGDRAAPDRQRPHVEPAGSGRALVDASRNGRREGRPEPEFRSGRDAVASADGTMGDASIARGGPVPVQPRRQDEASRHADGAGAGYLFPPGPGDRENWQAALEGAPELEPAFRRVADGLASRLDIGRVDRLRMLGNGVVPLQAAYAIRTLATRLAERGSTGATRLVRMMEARE